MTNSEKYRAFCATYANLPIFFEPFWWDTLSSDWQVLAIEYNDIQVFMPYIQLNKWGFRLILNPFYTPYSGLIYRKNDGAITTKEQKIIIEKCKELLPRHALLEIDLYPNTFEPSVSDLKKRTNLLLMQPEESLWSKFKPTLQRQIKKAERTIRIEIGEEIDSLHELHKASLKRQGSRNVPPKSVANDLYQACRTRKKGQVYYAIDANKEIHAGLWCVYDDQCMYYLLGGSHDNFRNSGAMSLLLWKAIQDASKLGLSYFDFEGSMHNGIDTYFKTFSPTECNYPVLFAENNIWLPVIRRIKKILK